MSFPAGLARNDEAMWSVITKVRRAVSDNQLQPDRRGEWFSSSQLDDLRRILETRGYQITRVYIVGKLQKRGQLWEQKRWRTLGDILEVIASSNLEIAVAAYVIAKLNQVLLVKEGTDG